MTWATANQLAALGAPGLPASTPRIRALLLAQQVTHRPKEGRGGGIEFHLAELPEPVQRAWAARGAALVKPATAALAAGSQAAQQQAVARCASNMARFGHVLQARGLTDPARNPRLDLFQRFETYHRLRGGAVWPAIQEFCSLWALGQIEALPTTLAALPQVQAKTLDKWYRAWRTEGVQALLERKPRRDRGVTALDADPELADVFVAALVEMHQPTARQVARVIRVALGAERVPSLGTLKRWMADYRERNKVALLKLKNPDGHRNRFTPAFGSRSEHVTRVNQEWQLDSTIFDAQTQQRVELVWETMDERTGEIRRSAVIAGIDVFTRRAKVLVSRTSNANAVSALTRAMILAFGVPESAKTDNGKDYVAQIYQFALRALQIEHPLCDPFSPDQKPFIERFIGTLVHDLAPMLPGYVGHDVATRKAIESGRSFAQRFGHGGARQLLTPEQLQGAINQWVDEYNAREHSALGCSPNEMAERHLTHVRRVDERALDIFMAQVSANGVRMVGKGGIEIDGGWYRAPELAAVDVMGTKVVCRQDDADIGAVHVFKMDGTYICRAIDHTRLGINRAEVAAKARAIEKATLAPAVAQLRTAARRGLTQRAVQSLYLERTADASDNASNVARLPVREVPLVTPQVASVTTAQAAQDLRRAEAKAALEDTAPAAAPVMQLTNPKQRYSAWVRLTALAQSGQALSQRDAAWVRSYEGSDEWAGWHAMQEGVDPLDQQAGGAL